MKPLILHDSGVIGLLTHPRPDRRAIACNEWYVRVPRAGISALVPPICYYEVRRERERLILRDRQTDPVRCELWLESLGRLERFAERTGFAPIDIKTIIAASRLWAEARHRGYQTASDDSLDADVILAATARRAARGGRVVHVITTNVAHIARYVPSCRWDEYPLD